MCRQFSRLVLSTGVLAALALCTLAVSAPAKERALRLERVELSAPFLCQRTDLVVTRPLEGEIRIGDAAFTARPAGKGLKVALEPGAEPKKTLGARGGVVTLRVPTGAAPRDVRVGISRGGGGGGGGGWEWAVVEGRAFEIDHAHYLLKNKWRPGKVSPHGEVRGFPGFTEAGHRAGQLSVIAWSDHGDGARAYWDTYYHRFPLAHPATATLGISDGTPSISVIDGRSGTDWSTEAAEGWKDPVLVPADGERLVATNFHRGGESPEPVAGAASRGYPLTAQFLTRKAGVSDFRARLVSIDKKGREEEVALLEPGGRRSTNRFGAIPVRPLRSGMTYRVTYTFQRDGEPGEVSATFRTY